MSDTICYGRTHKKQGIKRQENSVRRTLISPASVSADKSTVVSTRWPVICVFREVCVVYVSLSGEYMVSFVQSVEKSIMALQRDTYLDVQVRVTLKTRRVDTRQRGRVRELLLLLLFVG